MMRLMPQSGWTAECPAEPGLYLFSCGEIDGDVERLRVYQELVGETWELWVECPSTGNWPVEIYHTNLIDPIWRKA